LVIASGGRVREWAVKGAGKKNIFYFQTIDDADAIKKALGGIKKAVVVGGGFIAFELTEIFIEAKIPTTILCRSGSFFGKSLDREGNEIIRKRLLELGVNVIFGEAESVLGSEYVEGIHLKNGEKIFCDAIGLGIGLERNIEFLDGSGIETGKGIMTNEFLETRAPDIFAIGDIAEYLDVIMGKRIIAGNWTSAFLQGRNAGFAATGEKKVFSAVPSYSISVFGLNIDSIGDIGEPEAITHFDKVKNKYARFFISKGILVGAVIINNPQLKQKIFKLITEKSDFRSFEDKIFLG
jgi:NAD(P)H-nitrite reductase large subunit